MTAAFTGDVATATARQRPCPMARSIATRLLSRATLRSGTGAGWTCRQWHGQPAAVRCTQTRPQLVAPAQAARQQSTVCEPDAAGVDPLLSQDSAGGGRRLAELNAQLRLLVPEPKQAVRQADGLASQAGQSSDLLQLGSLTADLGTMLGNSEHRTLPPGAGEPQVRGDSPAVDTSSATKGLQPSPAGPSTNGSEGARATAGSADGDKPATPANASTSVVSSSSGDATVAAPPRALVVLGIDPDINGALAVLRWDAGMLEAEAVPLEHSAVSVHDMPCERRQIGKRMRRQANLCNIVKLVSAVASDKGSCIRAFVEEPQPNPMNGKQSWFGSGYSFGVWKGVLAAHGIQINTVSVLRWKADLALLRSGKEGSRGLALQLFPNATDSLKRKKDHGRAEALLIAAWGLGVRAKRRDPLPPEALGLLAGDAELAGEGDAHLQSEHADSGAGQASVHSSAAGVDQGQAACASSGDSSDSEDGWNLHELHQAPLAGDGTSSIPVPEVLVPTTSALAASSSDCTQKGWVESSGEPAFAGGSSNGHLHDVFMSDHPLRASAADPPPNAEPDTEAGRLSKRLKAGAKSKAVSKGKRGAAVKLTKAARSSKGAADDAGSSKPPVIRTRANAGEQAGKAVDKAVPRARRSSKARVPAVDAGNSLAGSQPAKRRGRPPKAAVAE